MESLRDLGSVIIVMSVFIALSLIVSDIRVQHAPFGSETAPKLATVSGFATRSIGTPSGSRQLKECFDADDGADLLISSYTTSAGGKYLYDQCKDEKTVLEATCVSKYGGGKAWDYDCSQYGMGCKNGRCV